jgi:molybdenum cofactor cytidylyltransferase
MGVGGLLSEIPSRPQPRSIPLRDTAGRPKIAAVVLAAGKSSRMGRNKLLLDFKGKPILAHVADQTAAAGIDDIFVVCGHQAGKVRAALGDRKLRVVEARDYQLGMSASLKAGIRALPQGVDAVLVLLGDMPQVSPDLIKRLIAAYNPVEGRAIVLPSHQGKRGNPVLFDRRFFPEMLELEGDVGARHLIGLHEDLVCDLAVETAGAFADVDTPDAYDQLLAGV